MVNVLKKGDFVIVAIVTMLVVLSVIMRFTFPKNATSRVVVKQDNEVVYSQSIYKDNTFDTGTNVIEIKDGVVFVKSASCKNQVCVNTGKISKKGESIVCLPNKVIVEIK